MIWFMKMISEYVENKQNKNGSNKLDILLTKLI